MKGLLEEFKTFITRGNFLELAVGIIIGNAFNAIVNSLINDVFMPILGIILSGVSFDSWYIPLNGQHYDSFAAAKAASAPMITIGNFISAIINFLVTAAVMFLVIKAFNKAAELTLKKKKEEEVAAEPVVSDEVKLLTEIRDALKKQA